MREVDPGILRKPSGLDKPVSMQMRAKLSEWYSENLDGNQQKLARFLIQSTVRVNMDLGIHPLYIFKTDGKVFMNGDWVKVQPKGYSTNAASLGEIICEVIRSGLLTKDMVERQITSYEPKGTQESTVPIEELRYLYKKLIEESSSRTNKLANMLTQFGNGRYYSRNIGFATGQLLSDMRAISYDVLEPDRAAAEAQRRKENEKARAERQAQMSEREKQIEKEREEQKQKEAREVAERLKVEEREAKEAEEAEEKAKRLKAEMENAADDAWLDAKFTEIADWLNSEDSDIEDVVSTATFKNSKAMLDVGLPREAILHAFAFTWSDHVKNELEIPSFDPLDYGEDLDGQHRATAYVEKLVDAEIPILLIGPTQTGKGFIAKNIANNRGLQFGSVPLNAGASIMWLFGRNMPQGYVSTDFIRCYEEGGVFLFDEIDAADANLLIAVNDALSNGVLSNPVKDMRIDKHENFIALAAANTTGEGADASYAGRERLDAATLERFRMGRVLIDYDRELQSKILMGEI